MNKVVGSKTVAVFVLMLVAMVVDSHAQTVTPLVIFDGFNGGQPYQGLLVQGTEGSFYGTTELGGKSSGCGQEGCGTLFGMTAKGVLSTKSFNSTDGNVPRSGVVRGIDGGYFGTTNGGGAYGQGTVFMVTPSGQLTTIYSFCAQTGCPDGLNPYGTVILGVDGNFYGTTYSGGSNGGGTVFTITPDGVLTTLYSFCSAADCADGDDLTSGLVQGLNGDLYGATQDGGRFTKECPAGCGTVFRITPKGTLTTVHRFNGRDGRRPFGALIVDNEGNLYGSAFAGGDLTCNPPAGCGVIYKITASGIVTTLHTFENSGDGIGPGAGLVLATDGNLYGATTGVESRIFNSGTLFQITPQGILTTLYNFSSATGTDPTSPLMQATDGSFYGTTLYGGDLSCAQGSGCGSIYKLDMGLAPFVAFTPRGYGRSGNGAGILGQGFTGTTSVSFNGTSASFTVVSDTFIKATVPAGATTGFVTVNTPSGLLTSNVAFQIIP